MEKRSVFAGFVLVFALFLHISAATICKPLSKFVLDCNLCHCSSSGREYSCTNFECAQHDPRDFYEEENIKDGYVLLKPKKQRFDFYEDDNDFVLTNKLRRPRVVPFIDDDEVRSPNSREDNELDENVRSDLEEAQQANLEDVSLEKDGEYLDENHDNFM